MLPGLTSDSATRRQELTAEGGERCTSRAQTSAAMTAASASASHKARQLAAAMKSGAARSAIVPPAGIYALHKPSALARSRASALIALISAGAGTAKQMK